MAHISWPQGSELAALYPIPDEELVVSHPEQIMLRLILMNLIAG